MVHDPPFRESVVHNLQMCMKEYCCCLKFRRGDNSTYTFTKRGGRVLVVVYQQATYEKLTDMELCQGDNIPSPK
jgi:hypothetical protein